MSFPRYTSYRDSGVEWLGEVPEGWVSSRLKHIACVNMGQSPSSNDCNIDGRGFPFLQGNAEFQSRTPKAKQFCEVVKKIANRGDLLFSVRAPVGALNEADQQYGIGRGLCSIRPKGTTPNGFLWWYLSSARMLLEAISTGSTFESVSAEQVGNMTIALPSTVKEQIQIGHFLDHETVRIDALIAEQQRLIELLKEKRQAVISHAVTKGLDPTVPLKDSGVEWLGKVPEHWAIKRVKFLIFGIEGGFSPQCHAYPPDEGEWGVLKSGCINGGTFNPQETKTLPKEIIPPLELEVFEGDVLMSRASGSINLIGSVAMVKEPPKARLLLSDKTFRLNLRLQTIDPDFFVTVMGSSVVRRQIRQAVSGAEGLANNIAQSDIKELFLPFPPLYEQQKIIHIMKQELKYLDDLSNTSINSLTLLKERRSALISAAVTGKIDVRGWQPPVNQPTIVQPAPLLEAAHGR